MRVLARVVPPPGAPEPRFAGEPGGPAWSRGAGLTRAGVCVCGKAGGACGWGGGCQFVCQEPRKCSVFGRGSACQWAPFLCGRCPDGGEGRRARQGHAGPVPGRALPLRGLPEAEAGLAGLEKQASCAGEGGARDSPAPQAPSFLVGNRFSAIGFR